MDLFKYFEETINKENIQEFSGDEYELALIRYVLVESSKLFYRNITFFLNVEQIAERHLIYTQKINPENVNSFEIVCSSYCSLLKTILNDKYGLKTYLIETDRDVFKHVALILVSKSGNKYFIDPLMDLSEMKSGMRTHNFASNEKNSNPYIRITLENLSYLDQKTLEKIDEKIGFKKNHLYTDDKLCLLKNKLDKFELISDSDSKNKFAELILNRPTTEIEYNDTLNFKIISFFELIRKDIAVNGLVDLMIWIKSSLNQLLSSEEKTKIKITDFFIDQSDLKDETIYEIMDVDEIRKRGILLEYNSNYIIFSTSNIQYLKFNAQEWEKARIKNNIFVKNTELISLYGYLNELELEPNILDHREFLKIFGKIEKRIIKNKKNPKDFIDVIDRKKIVINYDFPIEFSIENNLLVLFNKNNTNKYSILFADEGRNIKYNLIK